MGIFTNNLLVFVLALSFLLFTHELGHFLVGRLFKIEAEEFGFGYPPQMLKLFKLGATDFTLNWIPFGAFVRFKGEEDPEAPGGFYAANKWQRLGTLLSGSAMNIMLGMLLFSLVISQSGYPNPDVVLIAEVAPASPAFEAGMLVDDQIVAVNGQSMANMQEIGTIVQENLGQSLELELLRAGQRVNLSLIPRANPPAGQGAMGIIMQNPVERIGWFKSLPLSARMAWEQTRQLLALPGMFLRGEVSSQEMRPLSPKGLFDVYEQVRESEQIVEGEVPGLALLNIAWFFAVISTALGISNLLPIPALDGGRILFILPEVFFGKRVPARYENAIHMFGYVTLLTLMAYIFLQDFINPVVLP